MMIKRQDFRPLLLGASAFSSSPIFSANHITRHMPSEWYEMFDAAPIILPIPDGAPRELPLVVLRSVESGYSCTFTSDRLQIQWAYDPNKPNVIPPNDFYHVATNFILTAKQIFGPKLGRIAAISHRVAAHQNPALFLSSHFCKEEWLLAPFNRPEAFEINSHKKYEYKNFMVNSWFRNKSAVLNFDPHIGILIEQDLNTLQEDIEEIDFSENQISSYFTDIQNEFDTIFDRYYPTME